MNSNSNAWRTHGNCAINYGSQLKINETADRQEHTWKMRVNCNGINAYIRSQASQRAGKSSKWAEKSDKNHTVLPATVMNYKNSTNNYSIAQWGRDNWQIFSFHFRNFMTKRHIIKKTMQRRRVAHITV